MFFFIDSVSLTPIFPAAPPSVGIPIFKKTGVMQNPHNTRQGSGSKKRPGPQPRSTSSSAFAERSGSSASAMFSCIRCR